MIPVHNKTDRPIYVGAAMVPPGETRLFNEHEVPAHLRPASEIPAVETPAGDAVADLFTKNAKAIIAAVPGLSNEDLDRLGAMEQTRMAKGQPASRSTVLEAISEETLKRAEADTAPGGAGMDTLEGGNQE